MIGVKTLAIVFATVTTMVMAKPIDAVSEVEKRSVDWGAYLAISESYAGLSGQNIALLAVPGHRAICPYEIADLAGCSSSWLSECVDERVRFEWCLQNKLKSGTGFCRDLWTATTLACFGLDRQLCLDRLDDLFECGYTISVPPVPNSFT